MSRRNPPGANMCPRGDNHRHSIIELEIMLNVISGSIGRVGVSKGKIAVIAVIAFLTLTFFAIGYSAVESVEGNAAATGQQTSEGGENSAISAFKFV